MLTEFSVIMKLVKLIKMWLNEAYNKVGVGKNLCDAHPIQNVQEQRDALSLFAPFKICF
jgi:hypothetical protein